MSDWNVDESIFSDEQLQVQSMEMGEVGEEHRRELELIEVLGSDFHGN